MAITTEWFVEDIIPTEAGDAVKTVTWRANASNGLAIPDTRTANTCGYVSDTIVPVAELTAFSRMRSSDQVRAQLVTLLGEEFVTTTEQVLADRITAMMNAEKFRASLATAV